MGVTSKLANGSGLGLGCFTPPPPEEASLFSCANYRSFDRDILCTLKKAFSERTILYRTGYGNICF
jgi:hypothetical protein